MIYTKEIAKRAFNDNLSNRKLKQKGYFKEKNIWFAFDNSTEELFVEEFYHEIEALFWLSNFFEYPEKSYFRYFKIFRDIYYSMEIGFVIIVRGVNQTKLVY